MILNFSLLISSTRARILFANRRIYSIFILDRLHRDLYSLRGEKYACIIQMAVVKWSLTLSGCICELQKLKFSSSFDLILESETEKRVNSVNFIGAIPSHPRGNRLNMTPGVCKKALHENFWWIDYKVSQKSLIIFIGRLNPLFYLVVLFFAQVFSWLHSFYFK